MTLRVRVSAAASLRHDALGRAAKERLVYALSRFRAVVGHVTVQLSDERNPLGGVDTRCRMRAQLRNGQSVAVETLDGRAGIGRATERLVARIRWALIDGADPLPETTKLPRAASRPTPAAGGRKKARKAVARKGRTGS